MSTERPYLYPQQNGSPQEDYPYPRQDLECIPPSHDKAPLTIDPDSRGVPPPGQPGTSVEDPMQNEIEGFQSNETTTIVRKNTFIRKVYIILMCQLLTSLGMISLFFYYKPIREWFNVRPEIYWVTFAVTVVMLICMAYCTDMRRKPPMNFIFLILITLAKAFMLSVAASAYDMIEVLIAIGFTTLVCLGLTIFAFQIKIDVTRLYSFAMIPVIILITFGIFAIIWPEKIMNLVYAALGALIFCLYLVYYTQLIVGGKHKYYFSPEEYISAALTLYLDIINMFLYILTIISASHRRK